MTVASIESPANSRAATGASPQAEPPAGADMGPNPHGRGPRLRRARARSPLRQYLHDDEQVAAEVTTIESGGRPGRRRPSAA